ncbi:MAG: hypothetical protein R3F11_03025 [Verrucomicrobiales bacterium]
MDPTCPAAADFAAELKPLLEVARRALREAPGAESLAIRLQVVSAQLRALLDRHESGEKPVTY